MRIIKYGKQNDASFLAAFWPEGDLHYIDKGDAQEHENAGAEIVKIECDSGVYPCITDVEEYICDEILRRKLI
jgi:hypothetical protein